MKILATYNLKGGVGKTAAAVNLSYLSAQKGYRTLIWDLDPQGAATYYFRVKPKVKGGVDKLLAKKRNLLAEIKGTDFDDLDLIPADFSYRHADLCLNSRHDSTHRLKQLLCPLRQDYDFIFLDCPPNISLASENVFIAADVLLIPLIPTDLSLRAYQQLRRFRDEHGPHGLTFLPFFSMVDRRKRLHRDVMGNFHDRHNETMDTHIPYASQVELMGMHRAPVDCFAHRSAPAHAFRSLWREITDSLMTA